MKLGEICETSAGGTPLKSEKAYYSGGDIPWLLSGEVNSKNITLSKNFISRKGLDNSSAKVFPPNTVLVAMYGATAGQVGILRFHAATNQAVCGILPNDRVIPEYLYYLLLSKKSTLVAQAVGNAQPNISQQKIRNTEIELPPLIEQKRIVAMLDEAFADIDKARELTEQNLKNARELFVCYLNRVFEHSNNKVTYQSLDTIAKFSGGGTPSKKEPSFWIGDIPWVSPKDMKSEIIFDSIDHISKHAIENSSASLVRGGSILVVVRSGILARTIPIALAGNDLTVNQDLKVISAKSGIVPEYLYFFLRAKESYLLDKVTRGATVHRLSTDTLKELKIPVLSEKQQTFLAERCEQLKLELERVVAIYETKLDYLNELRNSLLANAFSGKLNIT